MSSLACSLGNGISVERERRGRRRGERWWEGKEEEEERWKEEGEEKRRVGRRVNDGGKG